MITRRDDIEDENLSKAEFWRRAAAFAFSAWAIAVPITAGAVIASLSKFSEKFDAYVLAMERRVTLLEERQMHDRKVIEDNNNKLDRITDNSNKK